MSALPAPLAHLLIANALPWPGQAAGDAAALPARPRLPRAWARRLPHLAELLRHMRVHHHEALEDDSPDTALERALAQAHGLPGAPGAVPWAAFESGAAPQAPCAWLTPCHWQLGLDHVLLADPAALALSAQEADALHAAVAPLLAEDGIAMHRCPPASAAAAPPGPPAAATLAAPGMRWLARGELLRHLHTCSVARATRGRITPGRLAHPLPAAPAGQAARLARLQNEIQMLLHTHPVNTAREAAGLPPVNALWISGAGALPAPQPPAPGVRLETRLPAAPPATPARPGAAAGAAPEDAPATWLAAWQAVDAGPCAELLAALRAGETVRLTLCGEHQAVTLAPARHGWRAWLDALGWRRGA